MKALKLTLLAAALASTATVAADQAALTAQTTETVTVANFVRAESDFMMQMDLLMNEKQIGAIKHVREPAPLDEQNVIRMNRDTIYSGVVLDLSQPATISLPETSDNRYQSMHVVSQDHYSFAHSTPGSYTLTRETVGSRYALVIIRTLIDANNAEDIKQANLAQNAIVLDTPIVGGQQLDVPNWNRDQLASVRSSLNELAKAGFDATAAFGTKDDVEPIDWLIAAAAGWGDLPVKNAAYSITAFEDSSGNTPYSVTAKDVPVNAFWSVTVYNKDGYIEENELGQYSFNNITADKNPDGSITVNFGGCEDGRVNCLPIADGWNYAARMYEPQQAILDGEWTFPAPQPVK